MNIDLRFPGIFLILFLPAIIYTGIYFYKKTLISRKKRIILILLRSLFLTCIILIIFDPILNINENKILIKKNLFLIDNSRSISSIDSTDLDKIRSIYQKHKNNIEFDFYLFGDSIRYFNSINDLTGKDAFSKLDLQSSIADLKMKLLKNEYSDIVMISDGNFTELNENINKLKIPFNFIHTSKGKLSSDLYIDKILYDEIISGSKTADYEIITGFKGASENKTFEIKVFNKNKLLKKLQDTVPSDNSLKRTKMTLPVTSGSFNELTFTVSIQENEKNIQNNSKTVYQKIFSDKNKLLIVYGNLSFDLRYLLAFLKDSGKNYQAVSIEYNDLDSIDPKNFDLLILYSLPSKKHKTLPAKLNKIQSQVLFITPHTDIKTPHISKNGISGYLKKLQTGVLKNNNSDQAKFLYSDDDNILNMDDLPYISFFPALNINKDKLFPVLDIISSSTSHAVYRYVDNKTYIFNITGFWKLFNNENNPSFRKFMLNLIDHLTIGESVDRIKIFPVKKTFYSGEKIKFSGKLLDENLKPLKEEKVRIKIIENNAEVEMTFSDNQYRAEIIINEPGIYNAEIEHFRNGNIYSSVKRTFTVKKNDLESFHTGADIALMSDIADRSGGKMVSIDNSDILLNKLIGRTEILTKNIKIPLVRNIWFFLSILLIFIIELSYRKYNDLL